MELLEQTVSSDISTISFLKNFGLGFLLSVLLSFHYVKFGTSIANRNELAKIFPVLTLTTLLIITVVKSSLALSLGLVGALSIIRFRTPIKEPEELVYLFICIAIGLGFGASQTLTTRLGFAGILIAGAVYSRNTSMGRALGKNIYITISDDSGQFSVRRASSVLISYADKCDLRRSHVALSQNSSTFAVSFASIDYFEKAVQELQKIFPQAEITFVDQSNVPGM